MEIVYNLGRKGPVVGVGSGTRKVVRREDPSLNETGGISNVRRKSGPVLGMSVVAHLWTTVLSSRIRARKVSTSLRSYTGHSSQRKLVPSGKPSSGCNNLPSDGSFFFGFCYVTKPQNHRYLRNNTFIKVCYV